MAFKPSPDGKLLAVGTEQEIIFCNLESGQQQSHFDQTKDKEFRFSTDGEILVVVGNIAHGKSINLYNTGSDEQICTLNLEAEEIHFSSDNKFFAIRNEGFITRYNLESGQQLNQFYGGRRYLSQALCFSPDGKILAIGTQDGVSLYRVESGEELNRIFDPEVREFHFSPNGGILAILRGGHGINFYRVESGEELDEIFSSEIREFRFSPNGEILAIRYEDMISLRRVESGERLSRISSGLSDLEELRFVADGKILAVCRYDRITFYEVESESGEPISYFDGSETREFYYCIPPEEFYFSPDGKILAILKEDKITISRVNYSD